MSLQDLGSIGELIASAAVLISLLYLASQIKQARNEIRQNAMNHVFQAFSGTRRAIFSDPNLSELMAKLDEPGFEPTKSEQIRIESLFVEIAFATMQLWTRVREGDLEYDQDSVTFSMQRVCGFIRSKIGTDWWTRQKFLFDPAFVEEIEALGERNQEEE